MTVAQLIEELGKLDPSLTVRVWDYDELDYTEDIWVQHIKQKRKSKEYCDINAENFK